MKIQIDTREPKKIYRMAKKLWGKEKVITASLLIGDIVYGNVCIERKTVEDFLNSMVTGHLQKQIIQMQENFEHCYVLISGIYRNVFFKPQKFKQFWSVDHYLGMIASVSTRSKIKILQVDNDTQLLKLAKKLIDKHSDGKTLTIRDTELLKNRMSDEDMVLKMACCWKNIGVKTAKKLFERRPEIKQLFEKVVEEMKK